ncbi:MAG: ThiF family adenylyltransferase [Candidatus Aenigmarchaeota archaeon]|nr:ThiF family adenylyltransferase [Candidatus Aenigmarchaeota archaeon]
MSEAVALRYDRQARIEGWNQDAISGTAMTIVGLNAFTEDIAMAAAALGIGRIRVVETPYDTPCQESPLLSLSAKPSRKERLEEIGKNLGSQGFSYLRAHMKSRAEDYFLRGSNIVIDASGRQECRALCLNYAANHGKGFESVCFYNRGLSFSLAGLPENPFVTHEKNGADPIDPVTAMIAAGTCLEEGKKGIFRERIERKPVTYEILSPLESFSEDYSGINALVVGAGALGSFLVPRLAFMGVRKITVMDPDSVEEINLNRQLPYFDAIGEEKARVLVDRSRVIFCKRRKFWRFDKPEYQGIADRFTERSSVENFDVVFDCVDNFETRRLLSGKSVESGVPLVSGGTSHDSGQVITYLPRKTTCLNHAMELEKIVGERKGQREEASCIAQPDPSVIMSNMVTAGMMVNEFRRLSNPRAFGEPRNTIKRYESLGMNRFGEMNLGQPCHNEVTK